MTVTTTRKLPHRARWNKKTGWHYTDYRPVTLVWDGPMAEASAAFSKATEDNVTALQNAELGRIHDRTLALEYEQRSASAVALAG